MSGLLSVDELAALVDEPISTLNHWASVGILRVAQRHGRKRLFDQTDSVRRCKAIRKMQNENLPLDYIRSKLD